MSANAVVEVVDPLRQRGRTALIVLFALIGVVGIAGAIAIAATAGDAPGAGLSVFYALIPLPLLLLAYWWLDRYEPEPLRYKFAAFVWGGVVAVAFALALEGGIGYALDLSNESMATFVAPPVEEIGKGAFLLLTFWRVRHVIDGYLDGLVFAGLVGIGFAFMENIGYYASSYLGTPDLKVAGAEGATYVFIVRGVFSPFAHPMFTSVLGIAVGFAILHRSRALRWLIIGTGLFGSVLLHFLWNGSLSFGGGLGFLLVYVVLSGALLVIAIIAIIVRVNQVRILEKALREVAARGWIHPDEIPYLARFGLRRTARRNARDVGGPAAVKVVKEYQALATETAFLHHALVKGRTKPLGPERRHALLQAMFQLRPRLILPAPVRPLRPS